MVVEWKPAWLRDAERLLLEEKLKIESSQREWDEQERARRAGKLADWLTHITGGSPVDRESIVEHDGIAEIILGGIHFVCSNAGSVGISRRCNDCGRAVWIYPEQRSWKPENRDTNLRWVASALSRELEYHSCGRAETDLNYVAPAPRLPGLEPEPTTAERLVSVLRDLINEEVHP